ncbi:MAG: hypothetical protein ABSF60_08645 [Verrucomicrobiota bacterium]
MRNATGRWQLMFGNLPSGVQTIRLYWNGTEQDITPANLNNGIYQIPDADVINVLGDTVSVEAIATNGTTSATVTAGTIANDAPYFVDGRRHLKQNLSFVIRGASLYHPFGVIFDWSLNQLATNFEEFSFLSHSGSGYLEWASASAQLNDLWPFAANYDLANYLVDVTRTSLYLGDPYGTNNFVFQPNFTTNIPAAAILAQADPYWIFQPLFGGGDGYDPIYDFYAATTNWGVTEVNYTNYQSAYLQSGLCNLFGLPEQTGCVVYWPGAWATNTTCVYQPLAPGDTVTTEQENDYVIKFYASWCPAPTLNFVNYYFAPVINPNNDTFNLPGNAYLNGQTMIQPYPLPILDDFNITNQTPAVMFGAVGQPMILGAWAKYSIQGSSPTKYAYLGQYFFTNAFVMDAYGNVTTTNTGVVSPYGEFFPTQPGPVALITMPDIDTQMQATGIVQVISLALDANHDGKIDTTFNGPDFVSANHPFRFWANNNYDRWATNTVVGFYTDIEQDDVASTDPAAVCAYTGVSTPDYDYRNNFGQRIIPCARDLEDFTRLWICGITTNVIAALPHDASITLSWGDVGNPDSHNPTIDVFQATDSDGGIGYLTNEVAASQQIQSAASYVGRLGPGNSLPLYSYLAQYPWLGNHFIWCGVSNGTGALTLTITHGTNVLAQTKTYIQIVDIKQMYERWTVGDNSTISPLSTAQIATNDLPNGVIWPFQYANPGNANTPYILHVHGYNMTAWQNDRYAETEFKRLYWQGYQGRFGEFRWPTTIQTLTYPRAFDDSEFNAWLSAPGLLNLLTGLNSQYPGHVYLTAHSHGNVVAGEALKKAGANQVVNTYIAMQAAIGSFAYDPTTPIREPRLDPTDSYDRYAAYWTNGAPCYFHSIGGAGTFVNFFNTNDWALTQLWEPDQNLKPDAGYSYQYFNDQFLSGFTALYFPQDTYTIFAYCDEARSYALGAQAGVNGAFQGTQISLPSVWPPDLSGNNYGNHIWHSAEFRSDYAQRWLFWNQVLVQMKLK